MASVSTDHGPRAGGRATACAQCDAPLAHDQRYCVECGARRGPLPWHAAGLLGVDPVGASDAAQLDAPADAIADARPPDADQLRARWFEGISMPTPRAAAVAIMGLLAFGVLVGSAISPPAQSNAAQTLLLAVSSPPAAASSPSTTPSAVTALAPPTSSTTPASPPPAPTPPSPPPAPRKPSVPVPVAPPSPRPPIKHVFLIVLSDHGYQAAFGTPSPAPPGSPPAAPPDPYLATTLTAQGELLPNYYAVTQGALANAIALISGQGPTPQTASDCPTFTDLTPATIGAQQQVAGSGCVYPALAHTLPDQLAALGLAAKAYVEDIGNGAPGQPATCRHPTLGAADGNQAPTAGDAYVTWRNPFVYFHSQVDPPIGGGPAACTQDDVGLDQLANDIKSPATTPSFAYIVPNRCHDGSEQPCAPGQPAGLAAADSFLHTIVPEIEASPGYRDGGLIAITFDEAPQSGPGADQSACCSTPQYPNLPTPAPTQPASGTPTTPTSTGTTTTSPTSSTSGITPTGGGGRVGLLLISRYIKPGSVDQADYNHFSLLLSLEQLFGLQPLGYAGANGLPAFDKHVYNAYTPTG